LCRDYTPPPLKPSRDLLKIQAEAASARAAALTLPVWPGRFEICKIRSSGFSADMPPKEGQKTGQSQQKCIEKQSKEPKLKIKNAELTLRAKLFSANYRLLTTNHYFAGSFIFVPTTKDFPSLITSLFN
jgi:hypothetical protein